MDKSVNLQQHRYNKLDYNSKFADKNNIAETTTIHKNKGTSSGPSKSFQLSL